MSVVSSRRSYRRVIDSSRICECADETAIKTRSTVAQIRPNENRIHTLTKPARRRKEAEIGVRAARKEDCAGMGPRDNAAVFARQYSCGRLQR